MGEKRNSVSFKVYGRYALFSDPITRPGGEKFSYQTPTYQALKGILESIYWKPTIIWYIDAVRVIKKIQTESKGIRPIKMNGGNDLSYYTYLREVEYHVLAHFEWNDQRADLSSDRDEYKHHNIAKRCIEQGGRRDIFLGTRECQAYVEPCFFEDGAGFYDNYGTLDFGLMFHSFGYPDETGNNELVARLWKQVMKNGIIEFPIPEKVELCRTVRKYSPEYNYKHFTECRNFKVVNEGEDE